MSGGRSTPPKHGSPPPPRSSQRRGQPGHLAHPHLPPSLSPEGYRRAAAPLPRPSGRGPRLAVAPFTKGRWQLFPAARPAALPRRGRRRRRSGGGMSVPTLPPAARTLRQRRRGYAGCPRRLGNFFGTGKKLREAAGG